MGFIIGFLTLIGIGCCIGATIASENKRVVYVHEYYIDTSAFQDTPQVPDIDADETVVVDATVVQQ